MAAHSTVIIRDMEEILALKKTRHSIPGARVLGELLQEDGISQQALADKQGIRLQSLVQTLKHLEKNGYIRFERNEKDKREKLVFLTESGRARISAHESFSAYCQRILQPLSEDEQKTLSELLKKVLAANTQEDGQQED